MQATKCLSNQTENIYCMNTLSNKLQKSLKQEKGFLWPQEHLNLVNGFSSFVCIYLKTNDDAFLNSRGDLKTKEKVSS